MSTWYVSKSGLDTNSGASYLLSKLTISGGVSAAASGDTIIVGSGYYVNETITDAKSLTFYADGVVVCDGGNVTSYFYYFNNSIYGGNNGLSFTPYNAAGQWIFKNYVNYIFRLYENVSGGLQVITLNNCILDGNKNCNYAIAAASSQCYSFNLTKCIFTNFKLYGLYNPYQYNQIPSTIIVQCTFYSCGTAIFLPTTSTVLPAVSLYANIFSSNTTVLTATSSNVVFNTYNYNLYYNNTNLLNLNSVNYTTLPAVQALGYELAGAVSDPQFVDVANNCFYLKQQHALYPNIVQVGMYPYGYTRGAANDADSNWHIIAGAGYDNSGWYNPDGNITKNGVTGNLELTNGTSGVIWSPVIDTGIVGCKTTEIDITAIQVWPTNMIDTTISDVRPNYQTVEVRASDTIYNQNDGVLAWSEVKSNIPFTAISGQYLQCRLSLRTNDVAQ